MILLLFIQRLRSVHQYSYANYSVNATGILQVLYRYCEIVVGLVSLLVFTQGLTRFYKLAHNYSYLPKITRMYLLVTYTYLLENATGVHIFEYLLVNVRNFTGVYWNIQNVLAISGFGRYCQFQILRVVSILLTISQSPTEISVLGFLLHK